VLEDLQLYRTLTMPLGRPASTFTSLLQVAKRLRVDDSKARRSLARVEEYMAQRLIVTEGRKLTLTPAGLRLSELAGQIEDLRGGGITGDGPELFVIDAEPLLAELLLSMAFNDFISVFAESIQVHVTRFDRGTISERLDSGAAHLGLGWADGEATKSVEVIDVPVPWVVVLPRDHSFSKREVPADGLAQFDRVFFADERTILATASALQAVPPGRRIECGSVSSVLAFVAAGCGGVGLVPSMPWSQTLSDPRLRAVPISGLEPEKVAIFLPKRSGSISEAGDSLRTILKRVALEPQQNSEIVPAETNDDVTEARELVAAL
jgi:DNA-binding transcriptional LysR family regulator